MKNISLIKDKAHFVSFAMEHTIKETAEYFNLPVSYVKNYVRNHKITYKKDSMFHGMSKHRLYIIFNGMRQRCYNKKHRFYKYYGGKGVTICDSWLVDKKLFFEWAFENGYKENLVIDRIDANKNYSPDNCRFVTKAENVYNIESVNCYKGVPLGLIAKNECCNPLQLDTNTIIKRITGDYGRLKSWDIVTALTTKKTGVRGSHKILLPEIQLQENVINALNNLVCTKTHEKTRVGSTKRHEKLKKSENRKLV